MTTDHFTTFSTVGTPDIADISKGQARDNNGTSGDWYSIDWFGTYYDATSGWIYHNDLGWLYAKKRVTKLLVSMIVLWVGYGPDRLISTAAILKNHFFTLQPKGHGFSTGLLMVKVFSLKMKTDNGHSSTSEGFTKAKI